MWLYNCTKPQNSYLCFRNELFYGTGPCSAGCGDAFTTLPLSHTSPYSLDSSRVSLHFTLLLSRKCKLLTQVSRDSFPLPPFSQSFSQWNNGVPSKLDTWRPPSAPLSSAYYTLCIFYKGHREIVTSSVPYKEVSMSTSLSLKCEDEDMTENGILSRRVCRML